MPAAATVLAALAGASLHGAAFILLVAFLCRLVRLPPALRCWLWWLASLKLLIGLAGTIAVPLPVPLPVAAPAGATTAQSPALDPYVGGGPRRPHLAASPVQAPGRRARAVWPSLAILWLGGMIALVMRGARDLTAVSRLRRESTPVVDPDLVATAARLARDLGLAAPPELRQSDAVVAPQLVGLRRPAILLPPAALALDRERLALALCHELHHCRRHDLWWGLVPAIARRVFFFHPLAWLAESEYLVARESACDAAVLAAPGTTAHAYGRLLLHFGVARRTSLPATAGTSSPLAQLRRRLEMIEHLSAEPEHHRRRWSWPLIATALVLLLPFQVVAVSEDEPAPPAPRTPRAARATTTETPALAPLPATPALSPRAVAPAVAPAPLPAPPFTPRADRDDDDAVADGVAGGVSARVAEADDDDDPYILLHGDSTIMHGSRRDLRLALRQRRDGESLLWFERGDHTYVVRDPAAVDRARQGFAPQGDLDARQSKLGMEQGKLGTQQAALGVEQAKLGLKQAEINAREAELSWRQVSAQATTGPDGASAAAEERFEAEREALRREVEALSEAQERIGREQEKLGEAQEDLGREQEKIGREQERLGRAGERKLRQLLGGYVASGVAERVE